MSNFHGNNVAVLSPPLPIKEGDKIQWGQLTGSAGTLAIANAAQRLPGVALVITANNSDANRLGTDLQIFLDGVESPPEVLIFPDWETLPYDTFSPHQDIISERMRTLYRLSQNQRCIIVASASTLLQRIAPKSHVVGKSFLLSVGDKLNYVDLRTQLSQAGYQSVDTVFQHGEYAVRGALMDIFPMGSDSAYRIELFDDEVESLREFDPETQRTIQHVQRVEMLPARECPTDKPAITSFKNRWAMAFDNDPARCPIYQDVDSGLSPAGVEYYLPLFFEQPASFFDYLPNETTVFFGEKIEPAVEKFLRDAQDRYESRRGDLQRPILPPRELFLDANTFFSHLKPFSRVTLKEETLSAKVGVHNFACFAPPNLFIDAKLSQPLSRLEQFIYETNHRVLFCAESSGRREALIEHLARIKITPHSFPSIHAFLCSQEPVGITIAGLDEGVYATGDRFALIAESQLFGMRVQQARRRQKQVRDEQENVVKNLTELKLGAPVVHIEHGVGRYLGLQSIEVDKQEHEFLLLEYANSAKLYVPVNSLHLISRYSGADEEHAPLHRLGSEQWQKAKKKAAEQIRDVAAELLEIYAKRKAKSGHQFKDPKQAYKTFCDAFPFEETPDQQTAIDAVYADMIGPQPMDRLVCGDVGFGKTEVAMRAAFIAVQNEKQVVVLVPTTLLAQQHYENFKDRFADWPVNVEVLSRFKSAKEVAAIEKKLEKGLIDIVIGTHKLLQGGVKYPRLGLLIIDEEHRFGVRQKEALKALRAEVDILTMTATPIPRTLNMAMSGIRDLSVIATPPAKRLSVKTFVWEYDKASVKEAVLREIMRGGQVYYLHNEVKTIDKTARELAELVPEARIQVGHGQMRERELEAVMSDFYHKRFNILVCTTIIETGIDVPTANTIIIERADKFGLAQLHQLRGRVGRSHHQAYAYLFTANAKVMTADAHKRLDAIEEAQDLGAGFMLASHDLEIRGAGELLGEEQSGQIQSIGFSLYMDLLDRAVKALQNGEEINLEETATFGAEVNLRIPALIPDDYLPDVHTRLILYKRISSVKDNEELDELQVEMIDRFGLLPDPVKNLIHTTKLKLLANQLGIAKIEANREYGRFEFNEKTQVDPLTLVNLVQRQPQNYRLDGATHLKFFAQMETVEQRIKQTQAALAALCG